MHANVFEISAFKIKRQYGKQYSINNNRVNINQTNVLIIEAIETRRFEIELV